MPARRSREDPARGALDLGELVQGGDVRKRRADTLRVAVQEVLDRVARSHAAQGGVARHHRVTSLDARKTWTERWPGSPFHP